MSKSVLVPLDGSERSETILPALDAVCASGDEIVLISIGSPSKPQQVGVEQGDDVLLSSSNLGMGLTFATPHEEPVYAESSGQALQRATAEIGDYLADRASELTKRGFTVKTKVIIDTHPAESIIRFAETMHPTLIAMATHSHNTIGGLIFSSAATAVLRSGVAPVLLVRMKDPAIDDAIEH
jgi:nucleotide-binding universal stress UspA family protein